MISKEDMAIIDGYANTLNSAVNSGFARNLGCNKLNSLNDVFERITGHRYKGSWGCPHCTIAFLKQLGGLYFAEKERLAKEVQTQPEPETVSDSAPKRKGGRSKKQATNNEQKPE